MVTNSQPTTGPQNLTLEFNDLKNLRSIIDFAARRGAFGAAEMAAIGAAYNKLDAFLSAAEKVQTPPTTNDSGAL